MSENGQRDDVVCLCVYDRERVRVRESRTTSEHSVRVCNCKPMNAYERSCDCVTLQTSWEKRCVCTMDKSEMCGLVNKCACIQFVKEGANA